MNDTRSKTKNQSSREQKLADQQAIQRSLKQIAVPKEARESKTATRGITVGLLIYVALIVVLGASYLTLKCQLIPVTEFSAPFLQRPLLGGLLAAMLLLAEKLARIYLISRVEDDVSRYNLKRLVHFFILLLLTIIVFSTLLVDWTTGLISVGILSIILGLALQAPLSNLYAWFYILIQHPYQIGDRIKIGECAGDVIEVGYFDTTLWEFGGEYLSSDHPSGRTIRFPNSLVLNTPVFNYSWPLFPYIWNEIKFYIAYESDLELVAQIMTDVAREKIGDQMRQQVSIYRKLLAKTPVDELNVHEEPIVFFRAHENTWIEAVVRYLVHPKQTGRIKTEMIKTMLARLNEQPDRVKFPTSNTR
ncbi:MAG: mechanosensitive ion channel family protein [Betaproteobacteria bacterium]|nr:mechanosensitive ion channel family protein [Betaproteobacteria bacterium]